MRTRERYKAVNALWRNVPVMKLEPAEALRAAKALLRSELGNGYCRQYRWEIANRRNARTYPRGGTWFVAPAGGWHDLVHDLSHYVHRRRSRTWFARLGKRLRPHHWLHANIESRMIRRAIENGWVTGALRPKLKFRASVDPSGTVTLVGQGGFATVLDENPKLTERARKLLSRRATEALCLRKIKFYTTLLRKARASIRGLERAMGRKYPVEVVPAP